MITPPASGLHMGDGRPRAVEDAVDIDGKRPPPVLKRHFRKVAAGIDARVVHPYVDASEAFRRPGRKALHIFGAGNIGNFRQDGPIRVFLPQGGQPGFRTGAKGHGTALGHERFHAGLAYARSPSGDDNDLPLQIQIHDLLLLRIT